MEVRTLRTHKNRHGDTAVKQNGRIYELGDAEAKRLIAAGLVEDAEKQRRAAAKEDDGA